MDSGVVRANSRLNGRFPKKAPWEVSQSEAVAPSVVIRPTRAKTRRPEVLVIDGRSATR